MTAGPVPARDTDSLLERLGLRVRSLRANLAMTRRALAAHARISERHLADLETGRGNISVRLLDRIAAALDTEISDLLESAASRTPEENLAVEFVRALPADEQKQALQLLRERFTLAPETKRRVALVGLRGAGKSTLGALLAERLNLPFVGLVGVVEGMAGMSVAEILALSGQTGYRRLEEQALFETLNRHEGCVIETGGSIVSEPKLLNTLLTACFVVWLRTEPEQYMARVVAQGDLRPMRNRPDAMSDLCRLLDDRHPYYSQAHSTVDTTGQTVCESLGALLRCLPAHMAANGRGTDRANTGGRGDDGARTGGRDNDGAHPGGRDNADR